MKIKSVLVFKATKFPNLFSISYKIIILKKGIFRSQKESFQLFLRPSYKLHTLLIDATN